MSTYIFHVLYQHSTPHAVTTLVVLLSASVCIFLWFNRKSKQSPAILSTDPQVVPELPPTNLSKETALEVQPPTPSTPAPSSSLKKNKPTKGDKKGDKSKKRQGKQQQDAPPAPKVRTLAHRRPARRLDDSAAAITEDHQEEHHAPHSPSIEASEVKPPEDGMSTGSQNSPPRAASPSPSEATTATTAATIQSSTLILTPPPTVLPSLVSLPVEHEKDARVPPSPPHSNDDATVRLDDAGDEESNATATTQIEPEGWIRMDNETPTIERREPPAPLLVPPPTIPIDITSPTSPQNEPESLKSSPTASTSNLPPPDDGETVVPSTPSHQQPPAIITPATPDTPEPSAIPRPSPSSQPRSLTPSEYPRSPRTRQGSSGGVGLGIPGTSPASGSQSRVGVSRSSPASSPLRTGQIPLPPRHRRHQPGQPPQQQQQQIPPPLLQPLPPYAHYGGRPGTPGSGMRSPTSPMVPFVGAPGWIPGPGYSPAAQQPPPPQAFLRPYPPPGYMHPPGPPGPHGGAAPPAGLVPYFYHPGSVNNSHGRTRSASDISPYQGGVPGMTSITPGVPPASQPRTAGPKSRSQDVKGKNKDTSGKEGDEEEDFVVEFPTLNPTPGKPSQSSESEIAGEGVSSAVNETQPAEQQPTGWMSPGYAPYPPEMLAYPPPWSPQAAAYFQPRPYPHPSQIPGVSTPPTSSTSSSPAWTHLGLPPPNPLNQPRPNAVATQAEGVANDQDKQQQQPYSSGPADDDLRRQTLANSIASKPGTSTPSASGSATSSPRVGFNHLHLMAGPSATPPYMQPLSPLTPTSGHVPLMPNPHLMRQGLTPSPGPMAASWHGNAGYFMPGPIPPHPHWIAAQNAPRSGTPSGEPASFLASPGSRSSSPFVGGRATPPVQAMYPGYFSPPPPHPNYPYGPAPPPPMQHPLMMQGMPPTPGPSYVNGRRSSANSSPLQSRSRKHTASESSASAGGAEEDGEDSDHDSLADVPDALVEAIFKDPEGFKAASVSSGRSSRGGSRAASIRSASETGGGGSEKGSACGSPTIEEEPPSAQTA